MLIDKRRDPSINPNAGPSVLQKSLGIELTQRGLDSLEPLHVATMPRPNLTSFNTTLTNNFRGFQFSLPMATNLNNASLGNPPPHTENADRACVPVNTLPAAFTQTSNYATLLTNALGNYTIYRAAVEARDNGSIPAALGSAIAGGALVAGLILSGYQWFIDNQCVQSIPLPSDFALCADGLSGSAKTLTLANIDRIELGLGALSTSPPQLTAQNYLGRLDGEIDAKLTNTFFRYKGRPTSGCSVRPRVAIAETAFTTNAALGLARTCRNLELDYAAPFNPGVIPYTIGSDGGSSERNLLAAGVAPNPLFNLGGNRSKNENKDICNQTNFSPFANTLLNSFADRERDALNRTWNNGSPATQQAQGLDLIFSRWETGIFGDLNLNDHILTQTYNSTNSLTQSDRIAYLMNSKAERIGSTSPVATGIEADPGPFPCATNTAPCAHGSSIYSQRFDMSYSDTTGALNQVVRELSATPLIEYSYQPTYADLSIPPPVGVNATAAAPLNAATLSQIDSSFGGLLNETLSISVRTGGIRPLNYINPQPLANPVPIPEGRRNLTYQLPQYVVELISRDPGDASAPPVVWMRILLDFYDPQFNLSMGSQPTQNKLTPAWSGQENWTETVESTRLGNCPTVGFNPPLFVDLGNGLISEPRSDCAGGVASRMMAALKTNLKNNLLYLLSRFPAPILYDAQGQVTNQNSPKFRSQDKFQQNQVITFYGELRP